MVPTEQKTKGNFVRSLWQMLNVLHVVNNDINWPCSLWVLLWRYKHWDNHWIVPRRIWAWSSILGHHILLWSGMRERTAIIRPFLDFIFKHCTSGIYLAMKSQSLLNMAIRTSGYLKDHKINDKIIREKITLQDF